VSVYSSGVLYFTTTWVVGGILNSDDFLTFSDNTLAMHENAVFCMQTVQGTAIRNLFELQP